MTAKEIVAIYNENPDRSFASLKFPKEIENLLYSFLEKGSDCLIRTKYSDCLPLGPEEEVIIQRELDIRSSPLMEALK